jgi:signal transduction histidine kinase
MPQCDLGVVTAEGDFFMTAQLTKLFGDRWPGKMLMFLVVLVGFILDHWLFASWLASYVWQSLFVSIWFVWLGLGGYGAARLYHFVRNLYLRFSRLEERLVALETEVRTRLEAESISRVAGDEAVSKRFGREMIALRNDARAELSQAAQGHFYDYRETRRQVSELKKELTNLAKREPSAELLVSHPPNGMINRAR